MGNGEVSISLDKKLKKKKSKQLATPVFRTYLS